MDGRVEKNAAGKWVHKGMDYGLAGSAQCEADSFSGHQQVLVPRYDKDDPVPECLQTRDGTLAATWNPGPSPKFDESGAVVELLWHAAEITLCPWFGAYPQAR